MKNPDRKTVSRLEALPNIGPAMAADLRLIGIDHPLALTGKDPFDLYAALCAESGQKHDPCVIDVFMSVVDFMEGGDPRPWWTFTDQRKKRIDWPEKSRT
ncbi:MAG: mitomycin resistance protein [Deltaproteobacteria bacterium]|nr:MAG: mitomycin resistance protein [Deltaproteobacteria bacterium]